MHCSRHDTAVRLLLYDLASKLIRYMVLQRYVFQKAYTRLTVKDKLALLEQGACPDALLRGCADMQMNFALDGEALRPAVWLAMQHLQQGTHGVHILDAGM